MCDYIHEPIDGEFVYGDDMLISDDYLDEKWWHINGYPDYMVSTMGRVWSAKSNWFLTPQSDSSDHLQVSLSNGHGGKLHLVHRLMGEAFLPNPNKYPIVRHLDDDPSNNYIDNLAWGTQQHNMDDGVKNGSFRKYQTPVIATNIHTGERRYFEGQHIAARALDVNQGNIANVLRGRGRSASGWHFEYADREV